MTLEEVRVYLEFYHELLKKYDVVMRAKLESLLKKRVVS